MSAGPPARPRRAIQGVAVVIPAHDEEQRLGACIDSAHRALDHRLVRSTQRRLVVVLDSCHDGSRAVADAHARRGDLIVDVGVRNVGTARAAGNAIALHELRRLGVPPARTWLANTDADTTVPPWWLARQLRIAGRADAVAGVVRVDDWSEHALDTRDRFEARYGSVPLRIAGPVGEPGDVGTAGRVADAHPHVHGANLGVRGDAYQAAGGFPDLACSEDHRLWQALRRDDRELVSTRRLWVLTSGRRTGRAVGGFADALRALDPSGASFNSRPPVRSARVRPAGAGASDRDLAPDDRTGRACRRSP